MKWWIAVGISAAVVASSLAAQPDQKVLFIGNSLTSQNNLPGMVEALARAAGDPPVQTLSIAVPGFSLEDHWNRGEARRALAAGGWSMVILQQGPSSQPDSQVLLRQFVNRFDIEAKRVGATLALYMVWPPLSGPGTLEQVSTGYRLAARDVKGVLLAAGDAFRAALTADPRTPLFGPDGFHPSPLGTYLAAVVIYQQLSGRRTPFVPLTLESPSGAFPPIQLTAETAALLKSAADRAAAR